MAKGKVVPKRKSAVRRLVHGKSGRRKSVALSATVKRPARRSAARKHTPQHIAWSSIALEELNPLLHRQFVVGQEIMAARVLLKKGCIVPEHSHVNEQLSYILEGALKFWIDGRVVVVNEGEVLTIPANMPHKAEALADTVDLDIFTPPREDWISKTDKYLR